MSELQAYAQEMWKRGTLGAQWLAAQVNENGELPCKADLGCYYKCIYPLRLAGYSSEASRVLERVMRMFYQPDGDLRNSNEEKASGNYTSNFCQVYPNGWIALGAFLLGRFDVVQKLMRGLMDNYYCQQMATFRSSSSPRVEQFDVTSAAMATELFLLTDISKAKRAGDFLVRLIDGQPDPDNWFYGRVGGSFDYITTPDLRSETYSAIRIGAKEQALWFLGLPCAALAQLFEYTGDDRYFRASERFYDTFLSMGEPGYRWVSSGKACWAAAILYRITGASKYLSSLTTILDYFVSLQQDDGSFLLPGMTAETMGPKQHFDVTPEYVRWFYEIAAELSVADWDR